MHRQTILVADDDPLQRAISATHLSAAGRDIQTAADGEEAWRRLKNGLFDALLLDLEMPKMGGHELIARIKADPVLRRLPLLIVSGRDDFETVEATFKEGAFVFCPKPVNWHLLKVQINQAIEEAYLRKQGYLGGYALAG
jgi:CheY-like chemotaxis protein